MHIVLKEILRTIFNLPPSPEFIGWNGERLTAKVLKKLDRKGYPGIVLRNAYVPMENPEERTEIDVLYITRKGVFVIESKNYSGWIFGSEVDRHWTQTLPGGKRQRFYNPIMQNATHVRKLWSYMTVNIPAFPIVAFSERCELKEINLTSGSVCVIKRDRLFETIRDIWRRSPDVLTYQQIDAIARKLEPLTMVDEKTKKAHVERIRGKYY